MASPAKAPAQWTTTATNAVIRWITVAAKAFASWITTKAWPWIRTVPAITSRYLREKRSPIRGMRLYNSTWRLLIVMLFTIVLSGYITMGSHLMWKELLAVEPKLFLESPWLRDLIANTLVPQLFLSLVLIGAWFGGLSRSRRWGMTFVPAPFLARLDGLIGSHGTTGFVPAMRCLMRHRQGRKGQSDMDLLVRAITDDETRRRNLAYCLDRSGMATARRYLEYRKAESLVGAVALWLVFFFYAHLILPFFIFPSGRWVPSLLSFIGNSANVRALATLVSLLGAGIAVMRYLGRTRGDRD